MITVIVIYALLAVALAASFIRDRAKTKTAFVSAWKSLRKTAPALLGLLAIVGLTLGLLPPETIQRLVGEEAGFAATLIASLIGAITLIPSLVAFPLAGSLLRSGATVMTISAFITTSVMVGMVTMPMEIKTLGKRFTLLRNGLGLFSALAIGGIMGILL